MRIHKVRREIVKLLFVAPALFVFVTFVAYPFVRGIYFSFTNWNGVSKTFSYIGFKNYTNLLADSYVIAAAKNTVIFTLYQTISCNIFGLLLALGVSKIGRLNRFLRSVYFMPFILSIVMASFMFRYLFNNVFYEMLGIKNLLSDPDTVLLGVAIIALWRDAGYAMIIYLAAIQAIPTYYYEAAVVDGASAIRKFFNITLPLIVPAITINLTLFIGWGLRTFDYTYVTAGFGPGRSSETLTGIIYLYTFRYDRASFGQAAAIVLFIAIVLITSGIAKIIRGREVQL